LEVSSAEETPRHGLLLAKPWSTIFFLCSLCFLFFPPFFDEEDNENEDFLSLLFSDDGLDSNCPLFGEDYIKGT
jgi:hypothetical protein